MRVARQPPAEGGLRKDQQQGFTEGIFSRDPYVPCLAPPPHDEHSATTSTVAPVGKPVAASTLAAAQPGLKACVVAAHEPSKPPPPDAADARTKRVLIYT